MDRHQVAAVLEEMAAILEITDANPFRIRAYQNGARLIDGMADFEQRLADGTLTDIKGIGKGLAEHITELITTGTIQEFEALHKQVPEGVVAMTAIPGLGPKKVKALWKKLKITSIDKLADACAKHKVAQLSGMGTKTETKILEGIDYLKKQQGRHLFLAAWDAALPMLELFEGHSAVIRCEVAGSLRRRKELVKDIDLVVSTKKPAAVMQAFVEYAGVMRVIAHGETKSSVLLEPGINADLRCVSDKEFPYALHHFTGSKEHNTAMRGRANRMQMKMNEYGLFQLQKSGEKLIPCKDEADIFAKLGLDYVPPELRENMGEIEAAEAGTLPTLIEAKDLRGVFHCHTTYSDGKASLEEMALGAKTRGLHYIGITDHSQSAGYAGGLEPARVRKQSKEIDALNRKLNGIRILKGIESDILKDGKLDYSDAILKEFDFVIASIHSGFGMSRDEMTTRICKALRHPAVRVLAHPTGRLLLSRDSYAVDMAEVLKVAGEHGVAVEINCNPRRSELDWRLGREAQAAGVQTMICPDAHAVEQLDYMQYGVGLARKGWWTKADVINAWPVAKVEKWLSSKSPRR